MITICMNFINNIKISNKIILLTVFPFVAILILSFFELSRSYKERIEALTILNNINTIEQSSDIIHELQKERGLSNGFLNGSKDKQPILEQRNLTNKILNRENFKSNNIASEADGIRKNVDSLASPRVVFDAYTLLIASQIKQIELLASAKDIDLTNDINLLSSIVRLKEIRGQTRALVNAILSKNDATKADLYELAGLNAKFIALEENFLYRAPEEIQSAYKQKVLALPQYVKTQNIIMQVLEKEPSATYSMTPAEWFKLITVVIDAQKDVETYYLEHIKEQAKLELSNANRYIIFVSLIVFLFMSIGILMTYLIYFSIKKSIGALRIGFEQLTTTGGNAALLTSVGKDEIGEIVTLFNIYMNKLNEKAHKDELAILAIKEAAQNAAFGFTSCQINSEAGSKHLTSAIEIFNDMLNTIDGVLVTTTSILSLYAKADFSSINIEAGKHAGEVGGLLMALRGMGESLGDFMALIAKSGANLENVALLLTKAANDVSVSSNQQATSLEETAASIEEMVSNLQSTKSKTLQMSTIASATKLSSQNGAFLTDRTVDVMNDIFTAASAINEALVLIENISFQTHILSLNAAIEAASAGEAGKGFAVVAGEVRNLAAKSAESAKHIRGLILQTQKKVSDGKSAVSDMKLGFEELSDNIHATTILIDEVVQSSHEQMHGITQISHAIEELNYTTSQNAKNATNVHEIAKISLELAQMLTQTAERTKYDKASENRVCRIDMLFDTSKLKLDHVNFKNSNFAKLKAKNIVAWKVASDTECDLGKWIEKHRYEDFAKTKEWQELLSVHSNVHLKVQDYINLKAKNADFNILKPVAIEIEASTAKLFDMLNKVKTIACEAESSEHSHQDALLLSHKF